MVKVAASVLILGLSGFLSPLIAADCCTVDDPIAPFRQCSPTVAQPNKAFLVKAINYTRYHDTLGDGTFDPDPRWNSITVWLARNTNRQCDPEDTGCNVSGPACKLIDCLPLCQTNDCASLGGGVVITNFTVSVPDGAGPNGQYYDLASSQFDRFNTRTAFNKSSWRQNIYGDGSSGLQYDNNLNGFNMTGMSPQNGTNTAGFYSYELNDQFGHSWPTFGLHYVPCRAYACARRCLNIALGDSSGEDVGSDMFEQAQTCINQCAGVDDIVNYCPDVGGTAQRITPQDIRLGSQAAFDTYLPDGCVKSESAAFPAAYASYSSSTASVAMATMSTMSGSAASSQPSRGAVSGRGFDVVGGLIVAPFLVHVLVTL